MSEFKQGNPSVFKKNCEDRMNIGDRGAITSLYKEEPGRPSWICKLADFRTQPG